MIAVFWLLAIRPGLLFFGCQEAPQPGGRLLSHTIERTTGFDAVTMRSNQYRQVTPRRWRI